MSISSIELQNISGGSIGQLLFVSGGTTQVASSFILSGSGGVSYIRDANERATTIAVTTDTQLLSAASEQYISGGLLTTINGVPPTQDGNFFIQGGACDSIWMETGYISGGAVVDTAVNATESGGAVAIYDLCPACQTCDRLYTLTKAAEYYKMYFNLLKDVNLYKDATTRDRMTILSDARIATNASCGLTNTPIDVQADPVAIKGLQLFQEYVTTVHMWNYVVSRQGTQTQITTAPEDDSGFVVQTKYALPACTTEGELPTLKCTITINCIEYPRSERVRVIAFSDPPFSGGSATQYPDKRIAYRDGYVDSTGAAVPQSAAAYTRWVAGKYDQTNNTAERISCFTSGDSDGIGATVYVQSTSDSNIDTSGGVVYSYNPFSLYMLPVSASYTPTGFNVPASDVQQTSSIEILGGSITLSGGTYNDTSDVDRRLTLLFAGSAGSAGSAGLSHAGVYNVSLKLLPFIKTKVYSVDSGGSATELTFDDFSDLWNAHTESTWNSSTESTTSSGATTTYYLDAIPVMSVLGGTITSGGGIEEGSLPTADDYNGAKTYPSRSPENASSGASVKWSVSIDWSLDNTVVSSGGTVIAGGSSVYSEHYIYEAAGAREYIDGLFYKTQLITDYTSSSTASTT